MSPIPALCPYYAQKPLLFLSIDGFVAQSKRFYIQIACLSRNFGTIQRTLLPQLIHRFHKPINLL
jgi:hypothetical protein